MRRRRIQMAAAIINTPAAMPIHIADNPLHSVAIGSGKCVEDFEALRGVLISSPRH